MVQMAGPTHAPETAAVGVVRGGKGEFVLPPGSAVAITRAVAVAAAGRVA